MKKGFTMIELIFVIVILGILASVAVPRLAATREDAEISAAVANVRTLISDASSYYVTKGFFVNGDNKAKWRDFTNVPLLINDADFVKGDTEVITEVDDGAVYLRAGGKNCIVIRIKDRTTTTDGKTIPAHIEVGPVDKNKSEYICAEILKAEPIKAYLDSKLQGVSVLSPGSGVIALGSSARVYNTSTTTPKPTTETKKP
ncbi:MAG: type II secretion system protein [Campylobacter sp.]|uniref:type II secretion system protein n=1 Tax=Campylobacter sp. TaxID=205 RepID=UPI002A91176F|nr:type II secretion system protein [Campylobacter sp.]MDY6187608.1 type II secretion system protein [Campylobacter sp.]